MMLQLQIRINYLFLFLLGIDSIKCRQGKSCLFHSDTKNLSGTCELINDCSITVNRIVNYFDCGTEGNEILVCCPYTLKSNKRNLRTHETKCLEYKYLIFGKQNVCQHRKLFTFEHHKLFDQHLANAKEFPHMALIGFSDATTNYEKYHWRCGGTLISERFVLTAGHCLFSREFGKPKIVRLGKFNFNDNITTGDNREDYEIEKTIIHPNYKISSKYHDIALIKLNRLVEFNSYICPACLPNQFDYESDKNVIATGWGNTPKSTETISISRRQLKKIILDRFSFAECFEIYKKSINKSFRHGIIDSIQLCAGSRNSTLDACQGDSGGPLQIYHKSVKCMYTIIGIISFGYNLCGNAGIPGVYTRVFPYIDWIERNVW